jgi:copper(I)-binding protein
MSIVKTTRLLLGLSFVAILLSGCGAPAGPSLRVEEPWARPAMVVSEPDQASSQGMGETAQQGQPMAGTGAVFMRLINEGREADRLIGGGTDVAQVVEIHETVMENDMMKMQMLAEGLEVPPRDEVVLKPGGYHIMLIGMQRELKVGDTFTIELQFEKSDPITLQPMVREP